MASPYIYQSSGGSGVGLVGKTFAASGQVWYVNYTSGVDAASPQGLNRNYPLKTLAQAHTNAAAGDVIWLLENHAETLTGAQTFNKAGVKVISEGTAATRARFTCNGAIAMFDVTAAGVWFVNLTFPQSSAAPTARIRVASTAGRIENCSFDCGANDTNPAVKYITGAGQCRIVDCSFTSTATAAASRPNIAVEVANAMSDLEVENTTFSGGTYGWSDYAFKGTAAITRVYGLNLSFLLDADWFFATSTIGQWNVANSSGSSRGFWTA